MGIADSPAVLQRHRLTVDEYYRMGKAGVFAPDARVELIEGEVIDMAPIGSRHARAVNYLNMHLVEAVRRSAVVAVQNPVDLEEELWPKLGDGFVRKAAYRGGWKPA